MCRELELLGYEKVGEDTVEGSSIRENPPKPNTHYWTVGQPRPGNGGLVVDIMWASNTGTHKGAIQVRHDPGRVPYSFHI